MYVAEMPAIFKKIIADIESTSAHAEKIENKVEAFKVGHA
jgi:hypothetical protein